MKCNRLYMESTELMRQAMRSAAEHQRKEWEATTCGVCGTDKWAEYPFCRSCSISARRMGLMANLEPFLRHSFQRIGSGGAWAIWSFAFDAARDYLVNRKKVRRNIEEEN